MFPTFNNFSETPCIKVGLDVRIPLIRVLSTRGWGEASPQTSHLPPPPPKKVFPEKNLNAISKVILFDNDIKESVKATNVQKCNFSQF